MNKSKSALLSTTLRLFLALSLLFSACFLTPNAVRPAFAAEPNSITIAGTSVVEGGQYIPDPNGGLKLAQPESPSDNYLIYNGEKVITIKGDMDITVPENKAFVSESVTIETTGHLTITGNTVLSLVNSDLTIGSETNRAGSVTIKNSTSSSSPVLYGAVKIYATKDVSISGNTTSSVIGGACTIDTTGDVTLENTNTGSYSNVLYGESTINTTGDVEITGSTKQSLVKGALTIGETKTPSSVEIKNTSDSKTHSNLIDGTAEIHANGNVTVTGSTRNSIFSGACTINTSGDVTLRNTAGKVCGSTATIDTIGDVKIICDTGTDNSLIYGALTIGKTKTPSSVEIKNTSDAVSSSDLIGGRSEIYATGSVTVTGNTSGAIFFDACRINTSGNVTLKNSAGKVCGGGATIDTTGDVKIIGNTGTYNKNLINVALAIGKNKIPSSVEIKNTNDSVSSSVNLIDGPAVIHATGNVTVTGNTSGAIFDTCLINTTGDVTLRNTNTGFHGNVLYGESTINTTGNVSITGNTYDSIVNDALTIGSKTHRAGSVTIKNNSTSSSKPVLYGAVKIYATKDVSISGNTTNSVIDGTCRIDTTGDVKIIDDTSAYYSLIDGDLTIGSPNVPAKSVEITNAFTPNDGDHYSSYVVNGSAAIYATGDVKITGRSSNQDSLVRDALTIGSDTVHAASITLTNKDAKALDKRPTIFGLYDMKAGDSAETASPVATPTEEDYKKAYVKLTAHTHNFTGEWKYDSTGHWHECPADGTLSDKQPHTFGDWTISGDKRTRTCECGYSETETVAAPVTPDVDVPMPTLNGWKTLPQGTVYYRNSVKLKGWQTLDGTTYYFDAKGYLQTGWLHLEDNWYYLDSTGARQTGWVKVKNAWYYLDSDGVMLSATWLEDNGKWYYLAPSGAMYNNQWRCTKGVWYYLLGNGEMAKNRWIENKGDWYYFGSDGAMLVSTTAPDGSKLGADGKWIG